MSIRSMISLLFFLAWISGCSSISLPSMPWRSGTKADPTAEALYDEGMRNFNEKRYVRAIDNFSKIRTDFPFSPQVTQIELKIADAYYLNQQYPEAINAFKEYQSMHPTNENIPFVILRLGQAHFDQFTSADRDQKNTEIAKGYFETVVTNYPKSPEAAQAREKLAKALEYLAEHEFNAAEFYFKQEKYPAARDRFEEIVRKYKDTPTAVKSLFFLGESYRNEKNAIRANLAYEALIQHYPQSKYAAQARTQMALVEKEKHDPLALLLMRDRRPSSPASPEVKEDPALAKLKDLNLVAKTEVVHEEPGEEKSFLSRVATKLNPFSSSDSPKKTEEKKEPTATELLARRQAQKKEESGGILASLWPFGSKSKESAVKNDANSSFVSQIDSSLREKGIDANASQSTLKPPAAALPNTDDMGKTPKTMDTATLLSSVDASLSKSGKDANTLPPTPEAAAGFNDVAAIEAAKIKAAQQKSQPTPDVQSSGILASIDQKLKTQGVDAAKFEAAPTAEEIKRASIQKPANVELEPKLNLEKGPLFLSPTEVPAQENRPSKAETTKAEIAEGPQEIPARVLVKGPVQPKTAAAPSKAAETKTSGADDDPKGVLDQLRQDMENVSKALNPFRW